MCKNKYYGRKVPVEGFKEALYQFLHNGIRLRTDALLPLIEKLQELKSVLSTLDTFRFYTSSLLLIYEGLDPEMNMDEEFTALASSPDLPSKGTSGTVDVKESSSTITARKRKGVFQCTKSADHVLRTSKLLDGQTTEDVQKVTASSTNTIGSQVQELGSTDDLDRTLNSFNSPSSLTSSSSSSSSNGSSGSSLGLVPNAVSLSAESVDVRMIDFAHALHSEMDLGPRQKVKEHPGSDTGFIFGLSNLIDVLQEIKNENVKLKC